MISSSSTFTHPLLGRCSTGYTVQDSGPVLLTVSTGLTDGTPTTSTLEVPEDLLEDLQYQVLCAVNARRKRLGQVRLELVDYSTVEPSVDLNLESKQC